ncbi:fatty acyl-AMP ligase [Stigmatella aurantiaca]|uniref:Beta-ketoacyl synthase n=1 Tax=Stigmatella aurantiaca (strain DW4/3-1) TaxID=378806 RepID=Q08U40_STIAD|nr:fatty acyl-AMP ligase [Stigmatella aurantiaca]ADO73866.1 Beta-ketoacyl synthase [Stigmatella aurantiaca DW4/3-1]EAU63996.1 beta-ketoacyl synthase [Stigmatella aurantiaca DW4/3-1]
MSDTAAERQGTQRALPGKSRTILDVLGYRAAAHGNRTAFIFLEEGEVEEGKLSFQELHANHLVVAHALRKEGLAGKRVLLFYLPGLDFVIAFFGCLAAGVVPIAVPPPLPTERTSRIQAIVDDAHAAAVLTAGDLVPVLQSWLAQSERLGGLPLIATDAVDALESPAGAHRPAPDDLAFLQYTSGSTTLPRGVMVGHDNLLANLECIQRPLLIGADSVSVTWLPCFHDMGLINGVLEPVYAGCLSVMMSPLAFIRRPRRWLEAISRYQATHSGGPNFAYDLCVRKIPPRDRQGLELGSWRQAYLSAEPIRRDTLERFHDAFTASGFRRTAFYPCYGLAEATLAVTGGSLDAAPLCCSVDNVALEQGRVIETSEGASGSTAIVGCGVAGLDTEVVIVDPETRQLAAAGQIGEAWVRGPGVARGYLGRPEETQESFQAHLDTGAGPFLRTGDLAFKKGEELFIVGRLKDVIIIRGRNYHPHDIEWSVGQSHPALRAGCAAAFVVDGDGSEKLIVVQELQRELSGAAPLEEVIGNVRQAVSEQHGLRLHRAVLVKTGGIPRTSSGKIQRRLCRSLFEAGSLDEVAQG